MIKLLFKGAAGYEKHYNRHIKGTAKEYNTEQAKKLLKNMPYAFAEIDSPIDTNTVKSPEVKEKMVEKSEIENKRVSGVDVIKEVSAKRKRKIFSE